MNIIDRKHDRGEGRRDLMVNDKQGGSRRAIIVAGIIGNIMEWYDFALYGYLAGIISQLFFPNDTRWLSLLSAYGIFAVGFIMRPIGSAIFGWLGDTIGRSRTMFISVVVMTIPTFILGLLPTYANIGILAPVLLVILRLMQGLSVGGEFSSSVTYLVETSPPSKRGVSGSWSNVGSGIGMLMGSLMVAATTSLFGQDILNSWGWRIPFLFGGVLGVAAMLLRKNLPKSEHFQTHSKSKEDSSPVKEAFSKNRKEVFQGMLFASGYGAIYYLAMVYLPTWLNEYIGYPISSAMRINAVATGSLVVLIPAMAWLSDRYIRRTHFSAIAVGAFALISIPLFFWLKGGSLAAVIVTQMSFAFLVSVISGVTPTIFVELFPERDRLSGYSISFNVGMGVVGGSTPMVVTWLISKTGLLWFPAIYLLIGSVMAFAALIWMKDRSREPLL